MQTVINWNEALQNTTVYWEEEVWSYPTYAIWTSKEQVWSIHLRNQHWYLSNWDDEGMYFTLGTPLPDIDSHNGGTQGRAPNEYKDVPIFAEYHTSSGSKEKDPTDEQICRSLINLSTTVPMLPTTPHPFEESNTNMSITTAITTQIQSNTPAGGAGPLGGGPPGGGGGGGALGGSGQGWGSNTQAAAQQEGKPMGALPMIFEGDYSKAESFIREFSIYLLVNHDIPALASFIQRITIALTCIKGPEVNWWTEQQLDWLMALQPADDNLATYQQFIQNFWNWFMDLQKAQRARIELQALRMTWPEIDEYISNFESIAHKAGCNPADQNTMQLFLQGLPQSIGQKVFEYMNIETYEQMKWKAISVTASQCIINQCLVQMTTQECPMHHLPKYLESKRAMPTKCPKPTTTATRVWTNPFQLHYCPQVLE